MSTTAVVCDDHSRGTDELTIPSHVIVDDHEANRFGFIFKAFPLYFGTGLCIAAPFCRSLTSRRIVPAFRDGGWLETRITQLMPAVQLQPMNGAADVLPPLIIVATGMGEVWVRG